MHAYTPIMWAPQVGGVCGDSGVCGGGLPVAAALEAGAGQPYQAIGGEQRSGWLGGGGWATLLAA
jgi:hypothetical protein